MMEAAQGVMMALRAVAAPTAGAPEVEAARVGEGRMMEARAAAALMQRPPLSCC